MEADAYSGKANGKGGGGDNSLLVPNEDDIGPHLPTLKRLDTKVLKKRSTVLIAEDFLISERPKIGQADDRKNAVQADIQGLIGMENVKGFFQKMRETAEYVELSGNMSALRGCLNLILTGNPGVGKTTVARLAAKYLHAYGILPKDHFKEINGLQLKGQYVGQTSHRVREIVLDALGGCLFIDEAYALMDRGGDSFSGEVVRTLLTEVENHRTDLLVILAGYEDKMEVLLDSDPGLRR